MIKNITLRSFSTRAVMTLLTLLLTTTAWAEAILQGAGTPDNPYTISSHDDWGIFASSVNGGNTYEGKYLLVTADIGTAESPITTMVGTSANKFKGTIWGGGHTLTFGLGTSESRIPEEYAAPFRYVDGATFSHLNISGSIYSSAFDCSGFIAQSDGVTTITSCHNSMTVNTSKAFGAGFICLAYGNLYIIDCLFDGSIYAGVKSSGFVSSSNGFSVSFSNCLFSPQNLSWGDESNNYIYKSSASTKFALTNSYYSNSTQTQGSAVGEKTAMQQAEALGAAWEVNSDKAVPCMDASKLNSSIISGIEKYYTYTGNTINLDYTVYDLTGTVISSDKYTAVLTNYGKSVSQVDVAGRYTLTLTAKDGSGLSGSQTFSFIVLSLTGAGTPADPYRIGSAADWDHFGDIVVGANGATKNGAACAVMTDNVPNAAERANGITGITTMIGTHFNPFQGTFNGAGHTLTVSYGTAEDRVGFVAPFYRVCNGATIKHLHMDGSISTNGNAQGIVRSCDDSQLISCRSSVSINGVGNNYLSGFAGECKNATFTNCLFDGELVSQSGDYCSSFVNVTYNNLTITNCLAAPKTVNTTGNVYSFYINKYNTVNISNSYYTANARQNTDEQGTATPTDVDALKAALGAGWEVKDGTVVPIMDVMNLTSVSISLPDVVMWNGGETISLDYTVTDLEGHALTEGTHYTATITKDGQVVTEVKDRGDYVLTLTAIAAGGYTGTKEHRFNVGGGIQQDTNGNYYVVMPVSGSKTVMPRGMADGVKFRIHHPNYPDKFPANCVSSIILNTPGYTMTMSGNFHIIEKQYDSGEKIDFYDYVNGTKATSPTSTVNIHTEGSGPTDAPLNFTPSSDQAEICFTGGASSDNYRSFYIDVTLAAVPYSITYYLNEGTAGEGHFTTYTTAQDYALVPPTREGYVFCGWYDNAQFTGKPVTTLTAGTIGDKTFYARWKKSLVTYPTITISQPADVTYNGSAYTPAITVKDGDTAINDECDITYTNNKNAGTATVTINGKAASNDYAGTITRTFKIMQKVITVNWASTTSLVYNGTEQAPAATAGGLAEGDACTINVSGATNVGNYTATATSLSNANYKLPETNLTQAFTIAPKPIGISWDETPIDYDGTEKTPYATATGLEGEDVCKLTVTANGATAVGKYTATVTGLSNSNYALPESGLTYDFDIVRKMENLFNDDCAWTGYVAQEDLETPNGVEAYTITALGEVTATASKLDYIPEGVSVLLKRTDKAINLYRASAGNGTEPETNLLQKGSTYNQPTAYRDYVLYKDQFILAGEGSLADGKVFLPIPANNKSRAATRSIVIGGNDTTAIDEVRWQTDDDEWYDLQGRKLGGKPTRKGLYINSGKKIIVK